jgi:metal-dependent hydrolase (beta-lactamase superfamily II)
MNKIVVFKLFGQPKISFNFMLTETEIQYVKIMISVEKKCQISDIEVSLLSTNQELSNISIDNKGEMFFSDKLDNNKIISINSLLGDNIIEYCCTYGIDNIEEMIIFIV